MLQIIDVVALFVRCERYVAQVGNEVAQVENEVAQLKRGRPGWM